MNPNIKRISDDILATNFAWLDAGYIKELGVMEKQPHSQKGDTDVLRITYDGRFIMNTAADSELYLNFLQAVMKLKDVELNQTKGFYKVIRSLVPHPFRMKPDVLICATLKSQGIFEANVTLFQVMSEWEQARRTVKKQYMKQNPPGLLPRIIKGR